MLKFVKKIDCKSKCQKLEKIGLNMNNLHENSNDSNLEKNSCVLVTIQT